MRGGCALEGEYLMTRSCLLIGGGLMALLLCVPRLGLTQPSSEEFNKLRQEIDVLKAGQRLILNDLQEIRKLLSAPRGGDDRSPIRDINTVLNVTDAFSKGNQKATLTLVEF